MSQFFKVTDYSLVYLSVSAFTVFVLNYFGVYRIFLKYMESVMIQTAKAILTTSILWWLVSVIILESTHLGRSYSTPC